MKVKVQAFKRSILYEEGEDKNQLNFCQKYVQRISEINEKKRNEK
jgi:hypothetical protein